VTNVVVLTPYCVGELTDDCGAALRIDTSGRVWHQGFISGHPVGGILTPMRVTRLGKYKGRLYGKEESSGAWYEWDRGMWLPLPPEIDMSTLEGNYP
jgi:hypothetical protein